jgi:hypothetical protein
MMAWHIFKKDLRLLWPLALAGAVGQGLLTLLIYRVHHSGGGNTAEAIAALVTLALLLTMSLSIVLAVQNDAPASENQDWLVRPIDRGDLLFAKVLFVAVAIHLPILACGIMRGLGEGFTLLDSVRAALLSALEIALLFSLPVTAVASLTKNVTEALVGALIVFIVILAIRLILSNSPTADTGIAWVWQALGHALLLGATIGVLLWQYFRRRTRLMRWLFVVGMGLFMLTRALPFSAAYAIQQAVTPSPEARAGTRITLANSDSGAPLGKLLIVTDADENSQKNAPPKDMTSILVPLNITALPDGTVLHVDRATWTLLSDDGEELHGGDGEPFDVVGRGAYASPALQAVVNIPTPVFERYLADRLELHYWFTVLKVSRLPSLPAIADVSMPAAGHCTSRLNADGTTLDLRCFEVGVLPCMSAVAASPSDSSPGTEVFDCTPNYVPALLNFAAEPVDHAHMKLPVRDFAGVIHGTEAPKLETARIVMRVYEPVAHFSQKLSAPEVRLKDLRIAPAGKT